MSCSFQHGFDVLIIGSGVAGLTLALHLAPFTRVAILSKGSLAESNTLYAQGGIAAVLDEHDSFESHIRDTLTAGAGLCDPEVVRYTIKNGPRAAQWLIDAGVPFSIHKGAQNEPPRYHLIREGGHSQRRIIHAADATGRAIETTLIEQVLNHPNIELYEQHIAIDLITSARLDGKPDRALGAYVLNRTTDHVEVFRSRFTVLATGGASKVYLYTTNSDCATGDGIAIGWRAGCRVANMEFNQFHPTCLYHEQAKSFLITEAVRGEGGHLLLADGTRFMPDFDERAELAPRDIVARAIDHEMKRLGAESVFLDISFRSKEFITSHFPTIYARCKEFGFDMACEPLPVVPAAHYTGGGLMTDLNARTDVEGLYAVGETAFTGLHGANRMASNSLLECLVFAMAAAEDIGRQLKEVALPDQLPEWDESRVSNSDEVVVISHNWDELRRFMWDYVGIVRTDKRLQRAKHRVDLLRSEIAEYYGHFRVTNDLLELRNLVEVADLIIRSALERKESLGLHYTLDYPERAAPQVSSDTILIPEGHTTHLWSHNSDGLHRV